MTVFCTYCSAEKDDSDSSLPAIQRYRSDRIERIHVASRAAGCGFFILSGEYGLVRPDEIIPYYDHLLSAEEAEAHAFEIARQIQQHSITQIIFFTLPLSKDEALGPYHAALRLACALASVRLSFIEIDFA